MERSAQENVLSKDTGTKTSKTVSERPLHIDLKMDFGDKSRIMEVLNVAYAGSVVDKRVASAAIREFQGMLDELYSRPPRWEMVTMHRDEVDNMRQIIKFQDQKIKDITDRVNMMSRGEGSTSPLPTEKDKKDYHRRIDLGNQFHSIYENEWRLAYSELLSSMRWRDAECLYALMRVIRNACDLCIDLADDQMDKILVGMEDSVIDPVSENGGRFRKIFQNSDKQVYSEGMMVAKKYAVDYRQERAESSVPAVIELFMDTKLRAIIDPQYLRRELKRYIERCVELIWLMTTMDPPMRLYWQQQTERMNQDFFEFYDRKGDFVNQAVFPAIFLHNTGRLLYKGKVLTM